MKKLIGTLSVLIFGVFVPAASAQADSLRPIPHIIGGGEAGINNYPFAVQLQVGYDDNNQLSAAGEFRPFCTGSLVAPQWVLTAAHCIRLMDIPSRPQGAIRVLFPNSTYQDAISADRAFVHPGYLEGLADQDDELLSSSMPSLNLKDTGTDVALLHLSQPAEIKPVRLAQRRSQDTAYRDDATIMGYGYTTTAEDQLADQLHVAQISLLSDLQCQKQKVYYEYGSLANARTQLCRRITRKLAGNQGITCNGDSGGPVLLTDQYGWLQVGVVSWGASYEGGCWGRDAVDIYSRVAAAYPWITSTIHNPTIISSANSNILGQVILGVKGRLGLRFKASKNAYQARWFALRSTRRPWVGYNWMPLWYLGEDASFRYATAGSKGASVRQTMPRGSWKSGQCLNLFWQSINRHEQYSVLQRRSWLVVKRRSHLVLRRTQCGYKLI